MTFDEVVHELDALAGRTVHVIVYVAGAPIATLDGELGGGVDQKADDANVRTFDVGTATFALSDRQFMTAERVGQSLTLQLVGGVEVIVYPWRAE
jgi:hypothetical protein